MSKVNTEVLEQFRLGQAKLLQGKCVEAVPIKRRIVQLMTVPLVQGALRYAYKVDQLSGGSKEKGEGAAFSAAILPLIASCDVDAATLISDNMRIDASTHMSAGFTAVKQAFESTYTCLGITCQDVGGLEAYDLAEACATPSNTPSSSDDDGPFDTVLIIVVVVVTVLLVGMCIVSAIFKFKANKYKALLDQTSSTKDVPAEVVGTGEQL